MKCESSLGIAAVACCRNRFAHPRRATLERRRCSQADVEADTARGKSPEAQERSVGIDLGRVSGRRRELSSMASGSR
jgi:hypothetical protein